MQSRRLGQREETNGEVLGMSSVLRRGLIATGCVVTAPFRVIGRTLWRWVVSACKSFAGPNGYKGLATLIAAYFGLYTVLEARHERLDNRASREYSTFISMASSGNPGALNAALRDLSAIQSLWVPPAPSLLPCNWGWLGKAEKPNEEKLARWANIALIGADLTGADLKEVALAGVNLKGAKLIQAKLTDGDLGIVPEPVESMS